MATANGPAVPPAVEPPSVIPPPPPAMGVPASAAITSTPQTPPFVPPAYQPVFGPLPWQAPPATAEPYTGTACGMEPRAAPGQAAEMGSVAPAAVANVGDAGNDEEGRWYHSRGSVRTSVAFLSSAVFHLVVMIVLALWMVPIASDAILLLTVDPVDESLETLLLEEELPPSSEMAWQESATLLMGTAAEEAFASIQLAAIASEVVDSPRMVLPDPLGYAAGSSELLAEQGGEPGLPRVVVNDYRQALDHITQELLRLLAKEKVLVVWCFDESESMKDDQKEISARIDRVYAELGMANVARGDALTTGVTSFGQEFHVHTPKPTTDLKEIRDAIRAVPICPSGEEMMCGAVVQSINTFRNHARQQNRRMVLMLVSDESGNRAEIDQYLEPTIHHAIASRCKVYVLGREAAFGQSLARVRWVHPETRREHWLPVDRGPESATIEQLQTDGFGERDDAHPSGFGPYAQSRLAWETGGKFFMLPSPESELAWSGSHRYLPGVLDAYRPDLRPRQDVLREISRRPLRRLITQVVHDLDPSRDDSAELMRIQEEFSADPAEVQRQIVAARAKAFRYYSGLERAIALLDGEKAVALREAEPSKRWKANYDLMRAQVLAYAGRVYLYGAALEDAAKQIDQAAPTRGEERLVRWRIRHGQSAPIDDKAAELFARAHDRYLEVIANHHGTPWAARAEWELKRFFGYPGTEAVAQAVATTGSSGHGGRLAALAVTANLPPGTGPGVGIGAGGGGGGGGLGGGIAGGMQLMPEYRIPPAPRQPRQGGGGQQPPPMRQPPAEPRIPIPKL